MLNLNRLISALEFNSEGYRNRLFRGKLQLRDNAGWSLIDISGGRSVPIYYPITYPKSININTLIDIPRL